MPDNRNNWVSGLVAWHGHDRGGVRIPFSEQGGNPLAEAIETGVIRRLRGLARDLAAGRAGSPRWVMLVGGPGNGKSEAVQQFLAALDNEMGLAGNLVATLGRKFQPSPIVPRRVEVNPADLPSGARFQQVIRRLIVIQDASASDDVNQDAARQLSLDLADLLTSPPAQLPVFICCANRGLLARCLKASNKELGPRNEVTLVIEEIIRATALGQEALSTSRPPCWPLSNANIACWPMDLESLFPDGPGLPNPVESMVVQAADPSRWETQGACADCSAGDYCPFRQNAQWLRDPNNRDSLLSVLRRGELATGQRWNFRDAFSLVAELVVGQRCDFTGSAHPCDWVRDRVQELGASQHETPESTIAAFELSRRLYPQALFPVAARGEAARHCAKISKQYRKDLTFALAGAAETASHVHGGSYIRALLFQASDLLDPAQYTPSAANHRLREVEDYFSQSVSLGLARHGPETCQLERRLWEIAAQAEAEWDPLGREFGKVIEATHFIRQLVSSQAKRSLGVRRGHLALEEYLNEYASALRDRTRLEGVRTPMRNLLGSQRFTFSVVESFGQPKGDIAPVLELDADLPGITVHPAPMTSERSPGHDVPCLKIDQYMVPLTFDFYLAIKLREAGCSNSCLPPSTRAAIDKVRHLYAGAVCRSRQRFAEDRARVVVLGTGIVTLTDQAAQPTFRANGSEP